MFEISSTVADESASSEPKCRASVRAVVNPTLRIPSAASRFASGRRFDA
jgi:hypothetical protein